MHAGRYRRGYDRNGAYLWDGFPRRRVVIASVQMNGPDGLRRCATRSSIFHTRSMICVASSRRCRSGSGALQHLCMPRQMHIRRFHAFSRMTMHKTNALAREAISFFSFTLSGMFVNSTFFGQVFRQQSHWRIRFDTFDSGEKSRGIEFSRKSAYGISKVSNNR